MELWIEEELRGTRGRASPPRRRPMVGLAFPVVAGTAVGLSVPIPPMWFWGAGALLLLPLLAWVRKGGSTGLLMLSAFFLMAAHAGQSTGGRSRSSLAEALDRPMEYVQFVAVALEDASPEAAQPGRAEGAVMAARVEGVNRDGTWWTSDDRIRVVLRGAMPGGRLPRYGERWRLRGIVRTGIVKRAGLFPLPENQAVVDSDRAVFLDAGRGNALVDWCMRRRRICREILGRGLEDYPDQQGVVRSLMMGYREDLPKILRKDFAATGTVHIFAISGSHVAMVTVLIVGLLRTLGVPLTRWFPILTPLLVVYTITTGAATSAVRSCVMAVMMLAAPFFRRRPDSVSTLFAAAVAILVVAPSQLGDLGFLLSFTAVAGLLAIPPVLDAGPARWFRRGGGQLEEEEGRLRRRAREVGLFCARYLNVTVGAWIATAPLTAYFFNLVSPVALAMNLLVIPAAFVILLAGVMCLICAPLGTFLPEVFNHAAWAVSSFLTWCIEWAADLPGGHGFVRTPPGGGILAGYAVLSVASVMARRQRGAMAAGLALLAAMSVGWGFWEGTRCRISVLDVGEGNAVLVKAGGARILVDAGPEIRARETLRALRGEGVNRLEAMILTHADAQHVGAASALMKEVPVREVWVPAVLWASPRMRTVLADATAAGVPVRRLRAGDGGDWPGGMRWEVLWPPEPAEAGCADDVSLALRVARRGVSVLLAGDVGGAQERALEEGGASLAASVLVVGRHGDASATSEGWLAAVRPRDAIFSAGLNADGRHPDEEVLGRLGKRGVRVWRTDRQGTIHIGLSGAVARWPEPGYRLWAEP